MGQRWKIGFRPEQVYPATATSVHDTEVTVVSSEMMGNEIHLHVTAEGRDVVVIVPTMDLGGSYAETFAPGRDQALTFIGIACHVFDKDGKNLEF